MIGDIVLGLAKHWQQKCDGTFKIKSRADVGRGRIYTRPPFGHLLSCVGCLALPPSKKCVNHFSFNFIYVSVQLDS